eukprot:UN19972
MKIANFTKISFLNQVVCPRYFPIVPANPPRKYIPTFTCHMYTWLWKFL